VALDHQGIVRALLAVRTRISAAVWLIVRDAQTAEDIFQDVSVKALSDDVSFAGEPQLVSWAQITARHQALNWIRSRKHRAFTLDESLLELLETEWAREASRPEGERIEALRECLEELPARSRRLIQLRYFDERPCRDVAGAFGVKLDAVYQRLARLHRALGQCIQTRLGATGQMNTETP
jgi:RNA polymerase sigma-70 factor (ECF subfamily)